MTLKSIRRTSKRAATSDRQKTVRKRTFVKANALYHELFASSPDGILLIDTETQEVIEFNDAACRQLGYTREEFGGLRVSDYEASETPEETNAHVQRTLREGKAEFDTLHRTKTGEIRHVHVWVKAFDLDGRVVFYVIFRDITERVRAEAAEAVLSRSWKPHPIL
jgi:PAS domain S-box-containing protein